MTAAVMTRDQPARLSWADRAQQSVLAILADSPHPIATSQLEAMHGMFYTGRTYNQLRLLEAAGTVTRIQPRSMAAGRSVYWWLAGKPFGMCEFPGCASGGVTFAPPLLETQDIYTIDKNRSIRRLFWREISEVPGTGGFACGNTEHQRRVSDCAGSGRTTESGR
jgi:hypothetical protein